VAAVEDAAALIHSLGHHLEEAHPAALDEAEFAPHFFSVVACHAAAALKQIGNLIGRPLNAEDVEFWTWIFAERGVPVSAADYLASIQWLQIWSRRVAEWWSGKFDLLLTPTIAEPPPPLGVLIASRAEPQRGLRRLAELMPFTPAYNVTGQPAVSLPLYWNASGLPIGVQLVAPFGREDLLIQIASQLEQARPWADRKPPICM
jgi:amidase